MDTIGSEVVACCLFDWKGKLRDFFGVDDEIGGVSCNVQRRCLSELLCSCVRNTR